MNHGGLGRWQALPLAIGSIAGSGILFLPSTVYATAGAESLVAWLVATAVCVPMLVMFRDIVRARPDGRGIEATVRLGLGDRVGDAVPLLFLAVVAVGLPSGAVVAGEFVARVAGGGRATTGLVAAGLLGASLAVNLAGVRASARAQRVGTFALFAVVALLLVTAAPDPAAGARALTPHVAGLGAVLPAVSIAFWTFAGFENLTFLAPELRDPGRDFLPVTAGSLVAYGTLTLVLTAALAATVPRAGVDRVTGLLQLADGADAHGLVSAAVAAIAVAVVLLNTGAWVWGTSRVATDAARAGLLPAGLAHTTSDGVPRRALGLLAAEFAVTGTVLVARPALVVTAVRAASDVFVVLYVLCIAAYARTRGPSARVALNAGVLAVLLVALVRSGVGAVYAVAALAVVAAARAIAPAASPSP